MVVLPVSRERRGDLVADQVLVGNDDMSRRFKEQLQLARCDHLGGLVNDLDVVMPLIRRDDPPFQSSGLSRLSHQKGQLDIGNLAQTLSQTDGIGSGTDLFARQVPDVIGDSELAGRVHSHRVGGHSAVEGLLKSFELVLEIGLPRAPPDALSPRESLPRLISPCKRQR